MIIFIAERKREHTNNLTSNITKHNHNNYEHNVIKKDNIHIKHINSYGTERNYYNKKSLNKKNYYNLYHDTFNFRTIISNPQRTDITNKKIETRTQATNYINENLSNNNEIATVILNPTPSLNGNYVWIPEVGDNVVPGLDSMITYTQSKYATLTALQNAITNIHNNIQTEINNLEISNQGNLNVNKELYYNTTHTDYTFQRNNTIHKYDNRRSYILQQNYFTYQRKGNQELQIQALNNIVADLQNQINSFTFAGSDPNEPNIGLI